MGATQADRVIDALLAVAGESTGLDVLDGPTVDEPERDFVMVGAPEGENPGWSSTLEEMDGQGPPRYVESWRVPCLLSMWSGDTGMSALRAAALTKVRAFDEGLRMFHRREGVWERARVTSTQVGQVQTSDGAQIGVVFVVMGESIL